VDKRGRYVGGASDAFLLQMLAVCGQLLREDQGKACYIVQQVQGLRKIQPQIFPVIARCDDN